MDSPREVFASTARAITDEIPSIDLPIDAANVRRRVKAS